MKLCSRLSCSVVGLPNGEGPAACCVLRLAGGQSGSRHLGATCSSCLHIVHINGRSGSEGIGTRLEAGRCSASSLASAALWTGRHSACSGLQGRLERHQAAAAGCDHLAPHLPAAAAGCRKAAAALPSVRWPPAGALDHRFCVCKVPTLPPLVICCSLCSCCSRGARGS